ncbi:MAG: hypothetical protein HQM03_20415, partial [Magnetococcales bacterium]|nr:hypothetical protein [Magnetococcales bacterium]
MLTAKQEAFYKLFQKTGNAEASYRAAYHCAGMSPGHVRQNAARELGKIEKDRNDSYQTQDSELDKNDSYQAEKCTFDKSDSHQYDANPVDESDSYQSHRKWLDKSDSHQEENEQLDKSDSHQMRETQLDKNDSYQGQGLQLDKSDSHQWMDFNNALPQPQFQPTPDCTHDTNQLKARLLENIEGVLAYLLPAGKARYGKFHIGDVNGNPGDSMVVELTGPKAGMWFDHATGQGGDILHLWGMVRGWDTRSDFPSVINDIALWLGETPIIPRPKSDRKGPPIDALGPATGKWDYHDQNGNLVACVYRYEPLDGKKEFRPWDVIARRKQAPEPRPLFNLPRVIASPRIVLVEGEKCAQALIDQGIVASTAMHGAKAPVDKTDWSPLAGKDVLIWPDKDVVGWKYAEDTAHACQAVGCRVVAILIPPADKPEKWDAADAIAEEMDILSFLATAERQNVHRNTSSRLDL